MCFNSICLRICHAAIQVTKVDDSSVKVSSLAHGTVEVVVWWLGFIELQIFKLNIFIYKWWWLEQVVNFDNYIDNFFN